MLYKGYVETKGKQSIEKLKDRTKWKTYDEIKGCNSFGGVLEDDTILIDIDDTDQSEIMMNIVEEMQLDCKVYQTSRGRHFLFKNTKIDRNKTHVQLAVGLTADIKIGTRLSYEVIKLDGKERFCEWDIDHGGKYQEIPKWMFPIKGVVNFIDMDVGDGRNQALFNYILTLVSNDFSVEETRETITILNQFVLKEPLSEEELEVVLRDEAFQKPVFFMGSTFLFDKFATYIKNNSHIIKINNQLHMYKEGVYVSGTGKLEGVMIQHIPQLSRSKRTEVLTYLDVLIQDSIKLDDANRIAFENGLYNLLEDSLEVFTPEHIITNKICWKYNPNAYSEVVNGVLNRIACNDPQIRLLLEEAIGYCFYRRNELGKAFILTGDKSNGKSTFLSMIQNLLGGENITALDLKELGDRFKTAELFGKLANIGDDIGDEFIPNPAIFKKLVTGDRVSVEHKGQNPFEFNNYAKMIFSANNIPRIKDKTGAVLRRLVIIPFNASFSKNDPDYDPYIKYKLMQEESMEYLIRLGIEGLKRIMLNNAFTQSDKVQNQLDEYEEKNNPIITFIADTGVDMIENEPTNEVHKRYQVFCADNNLTPMSNIEFSKQMNRILNFSIEDKKINGKKYRIFVRKNESNK